MNQATKGKGQGGTWEELEEHNLEIESWRTQGG